MIFQQGDVLIERISKIPMGCRELDNLVLAKGEVTGHCHEVITIPDGAEIYVDNKGKMYLAVKEKPARVVHPEHKPIKISKGDYSITRVREYDHFAEEANQVRD